MPITIQSPPQSVSSAPVRHKRRTFIVKRDLQAKFIFLVVAFVTVAIFLTGWDFYDTFGKDIIRDFMDPGLYELFQKVSYVLIAKMFLYMIVVGFVAALFSHKLAGPIYRFERSARIVADGDLTHRVHLRRGDELYDLQDEFNNMVDSIQKSMSKNANLVERVSKKIEDLSQDKSISPTTLKQLKEIKTEVDHLTSNFKI